MHVIKTFVLAAVGCALIQPGWAQDRKPAGIDLARSWGEAYREAQIRNVPIIFTTALAT